MSSTSTTWTTDTNTKSGSATTYTNTVSSLQLLAAEGEDAILKLFADEADDNADQWRIVSKASNNKLNFMSYASGAWSNVLSLFGSSTAASVYAALPAASKLYLDGGTHTYINESASDIMDFYAGGTHMLSLDKTNTEVVINEGSADINFRVEGNGDANLLFCDAGNDRVGIGTGSPQSLLNLDQVAYSHATNRGLMLSVSSNVAGDDNYGGSIIFGELDSTTAAGGGSAIAAVQTGGSDNQFVGLAFMTHDSAVSDAARTEAMRIEHDGNVGIGTASPQGMLHVEGTDDTVATVIIEVDGTHATNDYPALRLLRSKDAGLVADGDSLGAIQWMGFLGSNGDYYTNYELGASIEAFAAGTPSNANEDIPTVLTFNTTPDASGAIAERMRIDKDGNVGIGTASPGGLLDLESAGGNQLRLSKDATYYWNLRCDEAGNLIFKDRANTANVVMLDTGNVGIGTTSPASLLETKRSDTGVHWTLDRAGTDVATIGASSAGISIESATTITLNDDESDVDTKINWTSGIALMVQGSDGNVGIGTAAPENLLHIQDTALEVDSTMYDIHSQLIVEDTDARIQIISNNDSNNASALILSNVVDETSGGDVDSWFLHHNGVDAAGRFSIGYNANQTADEDVLGNKTLATDPFTILTSGNVGIGIADPDRALEVNSSTAVGKFYRTSSTVGDDILNLHSDVGGTETGVWRVECDGDTFGAEGGTYTSDERIKKNIVTVQDALGKVNSLRGATFEWKYAGKEGTRYGLIAQEVQQIIPELVREDGLDAPKELKDTGVDVTMGLNYIGLIPVLIEAVKELSAKVTALENA